MTVNLTEGYRGLLRTIVDISAKDEVRLKAAQEFNDLLDGVASMVSFSSASEFYGQFLEDVLPVFLKILQDEQPQFITELPAQQLRKSLYEIINRLPISTVLIHHVPFILSLFIKLVEIESEENAKICLRVILDLVRNYRPPYIPQIQQLLIFMKECHQEFASHVEKIFMPKATIKIRNIDQLNLKEVLKDRYVSTTVQAEKKLGEFIPTSIPCSYTLEPRGRLSLKVLQEFPAVVMCLHQIYRTDVQAEITDFIPIFMHTADLQPNCVKRNDQSKSLDKEVYLEFMTVVGKAFSGLVYIYKLNQEFVLQNSDRLILGFINLLTYCPMEVNTLRRELLAAFRHMSGTELKFKFIPHLARLLDDKVISGKGWTVNATMRTLNYVVLGDMIRAVKHQLSYADIKNAIKFFSRHFHDENLTLSTQAMVGKVVFELTGNFTSRSQGESVNDKELLMAVLDSLVHKLKIIVQVYIPFLKEKFAEEKSKPESDFSSDNEPTTINKGQREMNLLDFEFGFPATPVEKCIITELKSLLKIIIVTVRTISWGIASTAAKKTGANTNVNVASNAVALVDSNSKAPVAGAIIQSSCKQFNPKETEIYMRLFKWGLHSIDVFAYNDPGLVWDPVKGIAKIPNQRVVSKGETDMLEYFAAPFTLLNSFTFREIFSDVNLDLLVERILENKNGVEQVVNFILSYSLSSALFVTILFEFLVKKMPEMGEENNSKSDIYLRLFKLVFASLSLFADENEQILRPHLAEIANKSLELALNAKNPTNYIYLLRALFRSIDVGTHDLLYQQFLPLLPKLLQGLNCLQSGDHKPHMKELFIELCLKVPVRLGVLLPQLHLIVDSLVSAIKLEGSDDLLSLGLRTLELWVDNYLPQFLYQNLKPVQRELMDALFKILRRSDAPENFAQVAFRILGKLGGLSRRMLVEPQKLQYSTLSSEEEDEDPGQCLSLTFFGIKTPLDLPLENVVEVAVKSLTNPNATLHYKKQAWNFLKIFVLFSLDFEMDQVVLNKIVLQPKINTKTLVTILPIIEESDKVSREILVRAISGWFIAAANNKLDLELRKDIYSLIVPLIRHFGMVMAVHQSGSFSGNSANMDPFVVVEAIVNVLADGEKDLVKIALFGLSVLFDCVINVLKSKELTCSLPMMNYLTDKLISLCYSRGSFTKMGGCQGLSFLLDNLFPQWTLTYQLTILQAMFFVLTDLPSEFSLSYGVCDVAKKNLNKLIHICFSCPNTANITPAIKSLKTAEITREFVKQITSPITSIRSESMKALSLIAVLTKSTITSILEPHKETLSPIVLPKKLILRHHPFQSQIGLLDGMSFDLSLQPKLFTLDAKSEPNLVQEMKPFLIEIMFLLTDEEKLQRIPSYRNQTAEDFLKLKLCLLKVLGQIGLLVCWSKENSNKILKIFLKAIASNNAELRECGFESLKRFIQDVNIDEDSQREAVKPLLDALNDVSKLSLGYVEQFPYFYQLFPNVISEQVWEKILVLLRQSLDFGLKSYKKSSQKSALGIHQLKMAVKILKLFYYLNCNMAQNTKKVFQFLLQLVVQAETGLMLGRGSPLRPPLLKILLKSPEEYLELVFVPEYINLQQSNSLFLHFLKHEDASNLRQCLTANPSKLISFLDIKKNPAVSLATPSSSSQSTQTCVVFGLKEQNEIEYFIIKTMAILNDFNFNQNWISGLGVDVIQKLIKLWDSKEKYKQTLTESDLVVIEHQQLLIAKLLVTYLKSNPGDYLLYFKLLAAFCFKDTPLSVSNSNYNFLTDFLSETVMKYSVAWKRAAFFQFVKIFNDLRYPVELKGKIIEFILIPGFSYCFEKGEGDELIGTSAKPDCTSPENIVSVFILRVLDIAGQNQSQGSIQVPDSVRIQLYRLSCLFVSKAPGHIHDVRNKREGDKLKRLMTFAWPCLLSKICVDGNAKYYGQLLLSHIATKFSIHKKIVLQTFLSLLKAEGTESKEVVNEALDLLTPLMPSKMEEDGHSTLLHWTRKILLEEGHSLGIVVHILTLIKRHWRVFYEVRHRLALHMINGMVRLGLSNTHSREHKVLAVEIAEVIIKWEIEREKGQDAGRPISKIHLNSAVNFLIRFACQVNDSNPDSTSHTPSVETMCKRCITIIKTKVPPSIWNEYEPNLTWISRSKVFPTFPNASFLDSSSQTPLEKTKILKSICTFLDFLAFLVEKLEKPNVLRLIFRHQKEISCCIMCKNTQVIQSLCNLMSKLTSIFPTKFPTTSLTSTFVESRQEKYIQLELEPIYTLFSKVISEGLQKYENNSAYTSLVFGPIWMCTSVCENNPEYIDPILKPLVDCLQNLVKNHLSSSNENKADAIGTDLLIKGLELAKTRLGSTAMDYNMKKVFIGLVLVRLIDRSADRKVLLCIIGILNYKLEGETRPRMPLEDKELKENVILLTQLRICIEQRFANDEELQEQFFLLINSIYTNAQLKSTELVTKLEPTFLSGLRSSLPEIRQKFFALFNSTMRKRLHDRLLYILCSQNWEAFGPHFWLKQCEELLFATVADTAIEISPKEAIVTSVSCGFFMMDSKMRRNFINNGADIDVDGDSLGDLDLGLEALENANDSTGIEIAINRLQDAFTKKGLTCPKENEPLHKEIMKCILRKETDFIIKARKGISTSSILNSLVQMCYFDTELAEKVWISFFPRAWSILNQKCQIDLAQQMVRFVASGVHILQQQCQPSVMNTFMKGLLLCDPAIPIPPSVLFYLGKHHNLWHSMCLALEESALNCRLTPQLQWKENQNEPSEESLEYLCKLYCTLKEEDLFAGVWQRMAKYPESNVAIAFELQGCYDKAQNTYLQAMTKGSQDGQFEGPSAAQFKELKLWEDHYMKCAKELNQWEAVLQYSKSPSGLNDFGVLEASWRSGKWGNVKKSLLKLNHNGQLSCERELAWKFHLIRGYWASCCKEEQNLETAECSVDRSQTLCIRDWKALPHYASMVHFPLLIAAQQIVELHEGTLIHRALLPSIQNGAQEAKAIIKSWRSRLPSVSDDLTYWADIFAWRQIHYQNISQHFQALNDATHQTTLGVHPSAQTMCSFGKMARKQNQLEVCFEVISKIYTIPSVPIMDCFRKVKQQLKCYIYQAQVFGQNVQFSEAFRIVETTNLNYFTKEMISEFYAMKGTLWALTGNSVEANKSFSAACQIHDDSTKAWGLWGNYLETCFTSEPKNIANGISAVTAFMHAASHSQETKSRKYIAKIIWLLSYDTEAGVIVEAVEKFLMSIPPAHWLPWIPQLINSLIQVQVQSQPVKGQNQQDAGKMLVNLLNQVGRTHPQALHFPIRTAYLTLKLEQRDKLKNIEMIKAARQTEAGEVQSQTAGPSVNQNQNQVKGTTQPSGTVAPTPSMVRCSRLMQMQREVHPTMLASLEFIIEQIITFRENYYEELLRQVKNCLAKCYSVAFENRQSLLETLVSPQLQHFLKKLVLMFVQGNQLGSALIPGTSEHRYLEQMKIQFSADFGNPTPESLKLCNLMKRLKKWISVLEKKCNTFPKTFWMGDKQRYLINFSSQIADIEMPGQLFIPKETGNYIKISRFEPKVEIVQKQNFTERRIYIRGTNGKIYPYLIGHESSLADARREERVLQMMRLLNHYLGRQKVTAKRNMKFTVPNVIPITPQMRLMEDNLSSLSLMEVFTVCSAKHENEFDATIESYYELISNFKKLGPQINHSILGRIYRDIQIKLVSRTMLREWALSNFSTASDYWMFRKNFTLQLCLSSFAEYALHLTKINPEALILHQDSGLVNISYFKFDLNDVTEELENTQRPVPFRLTPNIAEFMTEFGINGSVVSGLISVARCLLYPNYQLEGILKATLKDEMMALIKRKQDEKERIGIARGQEVGPSSAQSNNQAVINMVTNAVNSIMKRIQGLASFEEGESQAKALVAAASSEDNLCLMDPAYNPWF